MKTTAIILLATVGGFFGGTAASHFNNPQLVQAQGYSAPQIFVNGEELKPVNNKIQIQIGRGDGLTSYVDQFGTLEVYVLPK